MDDVVVVLLRKENGLVYFKYPDRDLEFCTTDAGWRLRELEHDLENKYKVPKEVIREFVDVFRRREME